MNAQGSPAWFAERIGHLTASCMSDAMATIKSGEAASRRNLRMRLVVERLTGVAAETFQSPAMLYGIENEPLARMAYEVHADTFVEKTGFVRHPRIDWFGASPDGLVDDDGLVEIKVPNSATHVDYLLGGKVPSEYQPQLLAQLACTGRRWCDFISYDPRMPERLRLFVKRFAPDAQQIATIECAASDFLRTVDEMTDTLMDRREDLSETLRRSLNEVQV